MKIAIAREGFNVAGHFGHCEGFQVYEIEENKITGSTFLANPGHQPGLLPKLLSEEGAAIVIAGGIGAKAQQLFDAVNITTITGATGDLELTIQAYLENRLVSSKEVCQDHSHQETCGQH